MTDLVHLPNDVSWVETQVIKMHDNPPPESQWIYRIMLPSWLAKWDVFANWEKERFASMAAELRTGDVLFDIGTEIGWQSIIYAGFVGAANMVLIEPTAEFWPNIKNTWQRNFPTTPPLACYFGLISDKSTSKFVLDKGLFPAEAEGKLVEKLSYRYIHEHGYMMPQIKLDDYVKLTGIQPDALTMDTEGAELLILQGAEKTLKDRDLKVWVSIHPELGLKDYGYEPEAIHKFMADCGYAGVHLATDHEEHWYFRKRAA